MRDCTHTPARFCQGLLQLPALTSTARRLIKLPCLTMALPSGCVCAAHVSVQASFLEFAPAYFEHMAHAAATGTPTTLAKIAGVYSISFKQQSTASTGPGGSGGAAGLFKDGSLDVLVMENIFYDRQISRIYDLKGSERSRWGAAVSLCPSLFPLCLSLMCVCDRE